ncbi:O-methylsterigmatocystin oxidoreductase [Leucoagaricus sp. SymC.cos]|nr:O-methylsterigmatocystin oxidoreductase [Leucoagaricus sp. SymC.cos]
MSIPVWLFALAIATVWLKGRKKSTLPLPPGPPADPILGHLRYIPPEAPEDQFAEWSKIYGDIMLLRVLNRNMIILNTAEAAIDLMEKRSWNYNDRPSFPIFHIMGWVPDLTFIGYGKKFQKQRRLVQSYFSKQKVIQYRPIQLREARRLAVNLLEHPNDREAMLRRYSTSIIMRITYGHEIVSDNDHYMKIAEDSGYALTHCGPAGATPVDLFPILQYFPSWFPGTFYADKAREFNRYIRALHEYPFADVVKQYENFTGMLTGFLEAEGTAKPSFLTYHLERLHLEENETPEEIDDVKGAAGVIYCAGADTVNFLQTWSNLSIFMLAMTLHPECQVRAQQELDDLLEGSRLPEIEDRDALPYTDCILKETHRWLNALPGGDIMLLRVLNRNMIILNTAEAAIDLMEKRSWNYNDRPSFPIFHIMGWVPDLTFIGYGKKFQKQRRLVQSYFSKQKVIQYRPIQLREARRLAVNLLEHPNDREAMLRREYPTLVHDLLSALTIIDSTCPGVFSQYRNVLSPTGFRELFCGIAMNDAVYHDPQRFKPSRYLPKIQGGQEEPAPLAQFGFGRRICPGRHLADVSLWLAMVTILSLFDVKKVKGPDGREIMPEVGLDSGLTSHPKPYQCVVQLRNEKTRQLIEQIGVELMSE